MTPNEAIGMAIQVLEAQGTMLKCPSCGLEVHSDFNECPRCGANVSENPTGCDTCKHNDKDWDEEPCEECTRANSGYEQADGDYISRQAVINLCGPTKYDLPYDTGDRRGYDEGRMINFTKFKLLPSVAIPSSPCDLCQYNPPSSTDGKPCTMCPVERRGE